MRHALFALPLLFVAGAASAQSATGEPQINQLIVYGEDTCPPSTDAVINVCARLPEDDRYRIPPNLRSDPNNPSNQAWARRAVELSYVGRAGTESCSPTGPGGWTGCFNQMVTQARAERATDERINWNQLIDEARQERLRRQEAEILREGREEEREEAGIPPEPQQ
ncbi:hypothetical protein RCO27_07400 [Sphingosinicella sp. LHD-64]|uniref:hypothetical protein n=1 Tax=Sphingosinicella sp. LHD-64 TaxID=3072139 RepID=UPI00280D8BE4|nr:hypothetical protein [Sphingosinicella sp. LHD-64]MDQ8756053.1 hypothetical protein [Sphingosinicella sp. LHD-64]